MYVCVCVCKRTFQIGKRIYTADRKHALEYKLKVTNKLSFNRFSILSNSDLDPKDTKHNLMKGLHKLLLHTNFGYYMSTITTDIQFQSFFHF